MDIMNFKNKVVTSYTVQSIETYTACAPITGPRHIINHAAKHRKRVTAIKTVMRASPYVALAHSDVHAVCALS